MFCLQCGQQLPDEANFCNGCGRAARSAPAGAPNQPSRREPLYVPPPPPPAGANAAAVRPPTVEAVNPTGVSMYTRHGRDSGALVSVRGWSIPLGTVLAERFRLEGTLGRGTCGEVYLATDLAESRSIALKVIAFDPVAGPAAYEEVRRELVSRDRVNDFTHVLRSFATFTVPSFRGRFLLLIAMEWAPLGSLRQWLQEMRAEPEWRRQAGVEIFLQISQGLRVLHNAGLTHLDLKPENILMFGESQACTVKIADFEITPGAEQRIMNQAAPLPAGWSTFVYRSPEHAAVARQEDIQPAADIYSLGVILFELLDLHGKPPFDGSPDDLRRKHLEVAPPRLRELEEGLDAILKRCLAKKPEGRYPNAEGLVTALKAIYGNMVGRSACRVRPPTTTTSECAASSLPSLAAEEPAAAVSSGQTFVTNGIGMSLRLIPAGSFPMGSIRPGGPEGPIHKVTITKPFYLGVRLVTQAQYESIMGVNPAYFKAANRPIESVTWDEAREFCRRLSQAERCEYRLPTEAQWEMACRAGTTSDYPWGDAFSNEHAWCSLNSGKETHEVGTRMANPWGLTDMCGHLWEFCADWYGAYPAGEVTDPVGPETGSNRAVRGGSWSDGANDCRSAVRGRVDPGLRMNVFGFRVALILP